MSRRSRERSERLAKADLHDLIRVQGARVNNLKNVSFHIPVEKLTVVTGVSGSGKSSLAFDTIYAEGQRRYVESLSAYARQFLERMDKPDVDEVLQLAKGQGDPTKLLFKGSRLVTVDIPFTLKNVPVK